MISQNLNHAVVYPLVKNISNSPMVSESWECEAIILYSNNLWRVNKCALCGQITCHGHSGLVKYLICE